MIHRDRSRDGFLNTLTFLVLTRGRWLWAFVQKVGVLNRLFNWGIICHAINYAPFRPNALSTADDYTSWRSLSDRTFFGRHLAPVPQPVRPDATAVSALFERGEHGRASHKSTALFGYFAQWFTDGFMRSDFRQHAANRLKNTSNHEIDLCNLYGLTEEHATILRSHVGGRLKSQICNGEEFPPFYGDRDGRRNPDFAGLPPLFADNPPPLTADQREYLFAMGSDRANITTGYAMMNVLFLREHNRVARALAGANPGWGDERLFQTARNVMIVLLLKIVVEDYINHITPYHFKFHLITGRRINKAWHRPNWVAIEFNLLYRWHALTPEVVFFGKQALPVQDSVVNNRLLVEHGLAAAFAGASSQRAGEIGARNTPDFLVRQAELPSIQTGRLAELATYNDYRHWCGFPRATHVNQISSDSEVRDLLTGLYDDVNKIELYPGLFAEDLRPNSVLGPLMGRMVGIDALSQALTNPLLSEHVYNATTFSNTGLDIIESTHTLNDVVQRNMASPPTVSFTHKDFVRTSSWDRPAIIPFTQDGGAPVSTPPRTVNDAIVEAFTTKATRQFEAENAAAPGTAPMRRGAHPKHHGLVRATFEVRADVPNELRAGLFARPDRFDAYVRFSNSGREPQDRVPDAHGMAIKLLRVAGQGMIDDERNTQDFVLVDAPVFIARSPEDFREFLFLSGKLSAAPTPAEKAAIGQDIVKKFPQVTTLKKTIGSPLTVPYWSQVPYALGDSLAVKYKALPRVLDLTVPAAPTDADYLRAAMRQTLSAGTPVVFDFMVQRSTGEMPLDDPTIEWPEQQSPFVAVATLTIAAQAFESPEQMAFAERVSFNPWHALPEHRPLGRINASRREVYLAMQAQRHLANGVTHREPTGNNDF